jgi:hypothetical protein
VLYPLLQAGKICIPKHQVTINGEACQYVLAHSCKYGIHAAYLLAGILLIPLVYSNVLCKNNEYTTKITFTIADHKAFCFKVNNKLFSRENREFWQGSKTTLLPLNRIKYQDRPVPFCMWI